MRSSSALLEIRKDFMKERANWTLNESAAYMVVVVVVVVVVVAAFCKVSLSGMQARKQEHF